MPIINGKYVSPALMTPAQKQQLFNRADQLARDRSADQLARSSSQQINTETEVSRPTTIDTNTEPRPFGSIPLPGRGRGRDGIDMNRPPDQPVAKTIYGNPPAPKPTVPVPAPASPTPAPSATKEPSATDNYKKAEDEVRAQVAAGKLPAGFEDQTSSPVSTTPTATPARPGFLNALDSIPGLGLASAAIGAQATALQNTKPLDLINIAKGYKPEVPNYGGDEDFNRTMQRVNNTMRETEQIRDRVYDTWRKDIKDTRDVRESHNRSKIILEAIKRVKTKVFLVTGAFNPYTHGHEEVARKAAEHAATSDYSHFYHGLGASENVSDAPLSFKQKEKIVKGSHQHIAENMPRQLKGKLSFGIIPQESSISPFHQLIHLVEKQGHKNITIALGPDQMNPQDGRPALRQQIESHIKKHGGLLGSDMKTVHLVNIDFHSLAEKRNEEKLSIDQQRKLIQDGKIPVEHAKAGRMREAILAGADDVAYAHMPESIRSSGMQKQYAEMLRKQFEQVVPANEERLRKERNEKARKSRKKKKTNKSVQIESKNYKYSHKEPMFSSLQHALDHWGLVHVGDGKYQHFTGVGHIFDKNELKFMQHYGVMQDPEAADNYEPINKINEEVSAVTRMKLAKAARRTASRRKIVRKARAKRRRNLGQLKVRAKNEIISQLRQKFTGKRNWKKIPYTQRAQVDRNLARRKKLVNNMVKRIMPQVMKGESERLKNLNSSYNPIITNFLLEAAKKKPNREPLDSSKKAERRRDNTQTQREVRGKRKEKLKSGNVEGEVYAVTNKRGDVELVDRQSLRSDHKILLDADKASLPTLKKFLKDKAFRNTETSIRLFGVQQDAGGEKPKAKEKTNKKETKSKSEKAKKQTPAKLPQQPLQMPNMGIDPNWSMPKNKNQRGFKASDQEFATVANLEYLLNNKKPEDLLKEGLISEDDHNLMMNNQNLQQSSLRAAQDLIKKLGLRPGKHKFFATGRMRQQLSAAFRSVGATDTTMKSDIVIMNEDGSYYGVSVKYGSSQLGSPKEKELRGVMQTSWERVKPNLSKGCQKSTKDFIDNKLNAMAEGIKLPGTVGAVKKNIGGYAESNPKLKKQVDIAIKANKDMQKDWDKLMEVCPEFTDAVTKELMTGEGKFAGTYNEEIFEKTGKKINAGVATHVLSINEDGRSSSIDAIDDKMVQKIKPDLKFYIAMKTTDCGSSEQMKFYKLDFKPKLIDAARKGKRKDFEKLVKIAQGEYKRQGVAAPKFTKKDVTTFMEQAKDGTVANALKFKKHCSKSAFRVGKPGESSEEEVEESVIISCFIKKYLLEGKVATTSITGDPVYSDEDLDLTNINPDPEDINADAWLQYTKEYIGNDIFKLLDFMGLDFNSMNTSDVNFGEIFTNPQSSRTNLIYINGEPRYVPVFDSDSITEQYLEEKKKRNYRQEYDRYHSKPEQRKNRSKRVLARRLMAKLGKVHKGDGKDVDHKDGNPRNNGKHNLRVRNKSENRADND